MAQDGGSSTVDEFLVSIAITLGVAFVLYCFYVRFLPRLRKFLTTAKLRGQRLTDEDPKPSKIRKILNKLVIMILRDSLDKPNPSIQSIETEAELKKVDSAQFENTINREKGGETQKRSLPSSISALTGNDLGSRRMSSYIPGKINPTKESANDLNLLFRRRMSSYASGSAENIEGSASNLNRLARETNNDLITVTSDRGTHHDLLPFDTETSRVIEKKRRSKRSLTTGPSQILDAEEQASRLRKPREGSFSKNPQATMSTTIFKRSDFEDNRFKKADEIEMNDNIPDDTIFERNSENGDSGAGNKDKVVTLDDVIIEYEAGAISK